MLEKKNQFWSKIVYANNLEASILHLRTMSKYQIHCYSTYILIRVLPEICTIWLGAFKYLLVLF